MGIVLVNLTKTLYAFIFIIVYNQYREGKITVYKEREIFYSNVYNQIGKHIHIR
jgi:hypothetical protein